MGELKILISAYACEPGLGSEPGVGWNWAIEAARGNEVWVITRANNRPSIEAALRKEKIPGLHFIFFDLPQWVMFWKRGQRGIRLYYYLWQIGAWYRAMKMNREVKFDVVHHLTFSTCWLPGTIVLLPPPAIWGPVGGVESFPEAFLRSLSFRNRLLESLKNIVRIWGKLDPLVKATARKASLVLAQSEATAAYFDTRVREKLLVFPAVGYDSIADESLSMPPWQDGTLRIVSVGRLLYIKGFEYGVKAFALLNKQRPDSEYVIIGDGPEKRNLQRLVSSLNLDNKVSFLGQCSREVVLQKMDESDIFLHPSLRDPPVYVVIEAMARGLPVVCLHNGGPAAEVSATSGIVVNASTPPQTEENLAEAILKLANDPVLRASMGRAGKERVAERFCWEKKGMLIREMYKFVAALSNSDHLTRRQLDEFLGELRSR